MPKVSKNPTRQNFTGLPHPQRLAVLLWFASILDGLGEKSARALEVRLEPGLVRRKNDEDRVSGKWAGYARGDHWPGNELIERAAELVPDSRAVLKHPLWEILEADDVADRAEELLKRLQPVVQVRLFDSDPVGLGSCRRREVTPDITQYLEGMPGLDAVAAFCVLIAEARKAGTVSEAKALALSLWRVVLLASIERPISRIAVLLAWTQAPRFFPITAWAPQEPCWWFAFDEIQDSLALFGRAIEAEELRQGRSTSSDSRSRFASALTALHGGHDQQWRQMFEPISVATEVEAADAQRAPRDWMGRVLGPAVKFHDLSRPPKRKSAWFYARDVDIQSALPNAEFISYWGARGVRGRSILTPSSRERT